MFESPLIFILLLILLGLVAFFYASVGHGGASGYLAIMGIFSFSPEIMKPTALLLNILVSGIAFYFYYKAKEFKWNLFYPFALTSIPFAFLGGFISIETYYYKILLGLVLILSVIKILGFKRDTEINFKKINNVQAYGIGAFIGFLSGLIGIGGGIILSPIVLLLRWGSMKEVAAVSALFIFVNSIAGIIGFLSNGGNMPISSIPIISVVFLFGIAGAFYGSKKFNNSILRYILSFVLCIAIIKLIII
jgi:uncharacterized membrane protein YfcA